jgi:uncharacterized BrkB/YihY/UPF0761 family membrane protein
MEAEKSNDQIKEEDQVEMELDALAVERLNSFRDQLIIVHSKNQDSFEKQLSFISAGALALSIGFIKDIVKNFSHSSYKGLLGWGWAALIITLLVNCISHLLGASHANRAIKEINENDYEPERIERRNRCIVRINWATMILMIVGISLVVLFIIINTII